MSEYYTNVCVSGAKLLVRGIRDGKEFRTKVPYSPNLYIRCDPETGYKDVHGQNLKPLSFDNIKDARAFASQNEETNLQLYGFPFFNSQYCIENYPNAEQDWKREDIRIFNIDIEVTSEEGFPYPEQADYPITAICIHDSITDRFITFGMGSWFKTKSELPDEILDKVAYIPCESEHMLIQKFLKFWQDFYPQVVTGWNTQTFDMPYIYNRMEKLGYDTNRLSPWNWTQLREIPTRNGKQLRVQIQGIDDIDYLDRYRKNAVQESYRLDHIASVELGEKKLDYSEVSGLHQLFYTNFQKFIDYNIQDVNLVKRLDEKLGLLDVQFAIAYKAGINYEDVSGVVKTWDSLINKELFKDNKIPPYTFPKHNLTESIPGGYVKIPQTGKHGWVCSFDLNSLYPHLIMQYNISPETLVDGVQVMPTKSKEQRLNAFLNDVTYDTYGDYAVSAAGWCFRKDKEGIIPSVMRQLYEERKEIKGRMIAAQKRGEDATKLNLAQHVRKILLNSGYGAITNKYYRWFDQRLGESITLSGQYVIQRAEKAINAYMNKILNTTNRDYVIAIDTDSNYVNMQPLVDKFYSDKSTDQIIDILDKICSEQVQKILNKEFDSVAKYQNVYQQKMVMERECIADSAFWTAKKRYAMNVWDTEGVRHEKAKQKIQGLEAIRSSTPQICRQPLLDFISMVLTSDEDTLQKAIADYKDKFKNMVAEDIAMPRTMNNVYQYTPKNDDIGYKKGTPPHIRGAVLFNRLLDRFEIGKDWEYIRNGEKGKFIYVRQPNHLGAEVLSYLTSIPPEFEIRQYIDYEKMFEKIIVDPMEGILEPIGWTIEKQLTLTEFFG